MDRTAVFVDAGYLFAGGAQALSRQSLRRFEMNLDSRRVVEFLARKAADISGCPLLRVYWYDGVLDSGPTLEQQQLAYSDNVKLRLGTVNRQGQQKGVDGKILFDLLELARRGAICDAVLLSGDEDLRLGVEQAQGYGVRVHLLVIKGCSVASALRCEADTTTELQRDELEQFLSLSRLLQPEDEPQAFAVQEAVEERPMSPAVIVSLPDPVASPHVSLGPQQHAPSDMQLQVAPQPRNTVQQQAMPVSSLEEAMNRVVSSYLSTLTEPEREAFRKSVLEESFIPGEHDGKILAGMRKILNRYLEFEETALLREFIRETLE